MSSIEQPRHMAAQYRGWCAECAGAIAVGDLIVGVQGTGWVHLDCPKEYEVVRPICDVCWQEKSAAGACGCLS